VDPLYCHTLLSGGTEGCLHHSCGPAPWNHSHKSASAQRDMSQEGLASHAQLEDFTFQHRSEAFVFSRQTGNGMKKTLGTGCCGGDSNQGTAVSRAEYMASMLYHCSSATQLRRTDNRMQQSAFLLLLL
ncbi:hypothetical protein ILYODFUR_003223, partial [Ilyodon furcidens]